MTDYNTTSYNITQGLSYKNLEEHRYYSDEVTLPTTAAEVTGNTISNPKQATPTISQTVKRYLLRRAVS